MKKHANKIFWTFSLLSWAGAAASTAYAVITITNR